MANGDKDPGARTVMRALEHAAGRGNATANLYHRQYLSERLIINLGRGLMANPNCSALTPEHFADRVVERANALVDRIYPEVEQEEKLIEG